MGSSEFRRLEALAAITGNDAADGGRDSNRTTTTSKTIVSTLCTTSDEDMVAPIIYVHFGFCHGGSLAPDVIFLPCVDDILIQTHSFGG